MYGAVKLVLDHHQDIWGTLPAFATGVTDFSGRIQRISELECSRNDGTKGLTVDKHTAREAMTSAALQMAGAVRAYAASINSGELRAKVDYQISDFRRARDIDAVNLCQGIYDAANGINGELKDFGITAAVLKDFLGKITAYNESLARPRELVSNRRASGDLLETEFETIDSLLADRLDGLMERFRVDDPAFYTAYSAAREVVKIAGGHAGSTEANGANGSNGGNGGNQTPTPPTPTPTPTA